MEIMKNLLLNIIHWHIVTGFSHKGHDTMPTEVGIPTPSLHDQLICSSVFQGSSGISVVRGILQ